MTIDDIYALAKAAAVVGEPLVELPPEKILRTEGGRVFVEVRVLVDVLKAGNLANQVIAKAEAKNIGSVT